MERRVRTKDLINEINQIREKTSELKQIVEALPISSVKKAFEYSVNNLEKKIENFTKVTERMVLSGEEKSLISKFREARAKGEEISTFPSEQSIIKVANSMYPMKKQKHH